MDYRFARCPPWTSGESGRQHPQAQEAVAPPVLLLGLPSSQTRNPLALRKRSPRSEDNQVLPVLEGSRRSHYEMADFRFKRQRRGPVSNPSPGDFSDICHPEKESTGEYRVIVDLRYLNSFLKLKKFKLDSLPLALKSVTPNCSFSKTDLKSGFSHVKVARRFRKYLGFQWNGQYFHYRVLPFGLASSPYLFSKMLLPAIQRLRQEGIKIFVYVDDILIIANSPTECWRQTLRMRKLLSSLGWIVREDKSSMAPSSEIIFLRFLINSQTMTLRLPQGKSHTIVHELRRLARTRVLPASRSCEGPGPGDVDLSGGTSSEGVLPTPDERTLSPISPVGGQDSGILGSQRGHSHSVGSDLGPGTSPDRASQSDSDSADRRLVPGVRSGDGRNWSPNQGVVGLPRSPFFSIHQLPGAESHPACPPTASPPIGVSCPHRVRQLNRSGVPEEVLGSNTGPPCASPVDPRTHPIQEPCPSPGVHSRGDQHHGGPPLSRPPRLDHIQHGLRQDVQTSEVQPPGRQVCLSTQPQTAEVQFEVASPPRGSGQLDDNRLGYGDQLLGSPASSARPSSSEDPGRSGIGYLDYSTVGPPLAAHAGEPGGQSASSTGGGVPASVSLRAQIGVSASLADLRKRLLCNFPPQQHDLVVPNRQLKGLATVFRSLARFLSDYDPGVSLHAPELAVAFLAWLTSDLQGNCQTLLDQARQLFFVLFKMAQCPERNPMLSQLANSARFSLVQNGTSVARPDPPVLNMNRLVQYLLDNPVTCQDSWLTIRNRAILLYLLVLGRRPCNASHALALTLRNRVNWGLHISELGAKGDRSRKGSSVFLQSIPSSPNLCPVRAIEMYVNHSTTISIYNLISLHGRALFVQAAPGRTNDHRLSNATCSAIVSTVFRQANVQFDEQGRQVSTRDIRSYVYSLGLRSPLLKEPVLRHLMDWAQSSTADRHYLRGESPLHWPAFVLGLVPSPGDGFCSLYSPPPDTASTGALPVPTVSVLVDPHLINGGLDSSVQ